ncbi:hypothetical protein R615_13025 [Thalassolituus oleivorans R6-15]|nr:hypothetical protein R615_13025 [Thalassolituus oleivorans R6-15]MCA6127033.1 hypothetical protein [Thalassolituus oleivorans 4BN06-13]
MLGGLMAYGRYFFRNFDFWYQEYKWNNMVYESDGTLTYSFSAVPMEHSLSNPVYLDYLIMQANYTVWWIILPLKFVLAIKACLIFLSINRHQ